ncbi:hypothetical protein [Phaeobacter inhibens]|uniref:hypothetical protein n=1 Tax=Phaeobacter inhibens TaxID=221822 RepID=UPI00295F18F9|nr:hypothetical protein [Phaeobacter inhibens]
MARNIKAPVSAMTQNPAPPSNDDDVLSQRRRCGCTVGSEMHVISHGWDRYNSLTRFKCKTCRTQVDVIPKSHIGYTFSVSSFGIAFIAYFFVFNVRDPSIWAKLIVGAIGVFQFGVLLAQFLAHKYYPLVETAEIPAAKCRKGIIAWIEGMSFGTGIFLPVLAAVMVLGICFLLGIAIHYSFQPP